MDKLDLVLDIIGHPEKYSPQELERLLSDPEAKALYDEMCLISASTFGADIPDEDKVAREWQQFERTHMRRPLLLRLVGNRAAAVAAVIVTAAVAVAVGIGFSHSAPSDGLTAADAGQEVVTGDVHVAATSLAVADDSVAELSEPVVFEDETMAGIMSRIGAAYGVEVRFARPDVRNLRLYFKWDPSRPIDDVVADLNIFEQINITIKDGVLTVK